MKTSKKPTDKLKKERALRIDGVLLRYFKVSIAVLLLYYLLPYIIKVIKVVFLKELTIKVYGKWIWAGEYVVLKGYPALVFPLPSQFIELSYKKSSVPLKVEDIFPTSKEHNSLVGVEKIFSPILDRALKKVSKTRADLKQGVHIKSSIAFGAGIGSSAVLSVLIGRLFCFLNWIKETELFPFCHSLENEVHGQSSGVDISAVLMNKALVYSMVESSTEIKCFSPKWKPLVFLSYSKQGASTKANIQKVKQFWKQNPKTAQKLDQQMAEAVLKAQKGLEDPKKGFPLLVESLALAEDCFSKWNLIGSDMQNLISFLKKQGACGVKPVGSGSGGYVLSLWSSPPPSFLKPLLISAF